MLSALTHDHVTSGARFRYQHISRIGALNSRRAMSPGQGREEGFCEELGDGAVGAARSATLTASPWLFHSLSPRGDP